MKIMLDTSAYVGFKRNAVEAFVMIVIGDLFVFSPVVMGELMFGFRNGTRFKDNMDDLDRFLKHEAVDLVPIGKITSDRYSRIAVKLRQQGTPIPTNDIWLAAQAMEQGTDLITSDQHFDKINGLVYTIF